MCGCKVWLIIVGILSVIVGILGFIPSVTLVAMSTWKAAAHVIVGIISFIFAGTCKCK